MPTQLNRLRPQTKKHPLKPLQFAVAFFVVLPHAMSGLFSIAGHLVTIGFYGACGLLVSHILPTLYFLNIIAPNAKNGVGLGVIQALLKTPPNFANPSLITMIAQRNRHYIIGHEPSFNPKALCFVFGFTCVVLAFVSATNSQTFDPPRMSSGNETPSIQQQIITVCSKQ